jgi:transcriptional regulator
MPKHFNVDDPKALDAFIEHNAFATLVSTGAAGLHVSHIPLLPERDSGGTLRLLGHVARANAQWQALESATDLVAIFHGPHAYVSPSWYQTQPSVPTWNYAVVHAHGRATLLDEAGLHDLVIRLSDVYETGRPKPWRAVDLPADYAANMLKAIVGFEIEVTKLEGKFKLSQNRPVEVPGVIAALEAEGQGEVAALMRAASNASKG